MKTSAISLCLVSWAMLLCGCPSKDKPNTEGKELSKNPLMAWP